MGLTHRSLTSPCHSFADAVHLEGIPGLCWGWSPAYALAVQSLSCVRLFATPWIAARQASLSITNSQSSFRLTSIESVMPSSHLILCQGIKAPFKNKVTGLAHRSLAFPCHSFADAVHPEGTFRSCWGWTPTKMDYKFICRDFKVNDHIPVTKVVQFSLVAHSCLTLCNPMDCSMPGFPVHHQLLKLAQTHVHWVGDAFQPSHPLSSPSPPAFNLSHHQSLFKWVSSSHQVAKVLEFQLQHQSFQWIFRTVFL